MKNKKVFDIINYIAPVILFVFVTFSYVEEYIIRNTELYFSIHKILMMIIFVGLGLLAGYGVKVILLSFGKKKISTFDLYMYTLAIDVLVFSVLIYLFTGVFEYPNTLIKVSKVMCFIFIAYFASSIMKKYILKKGRTGRYVFAGILTSFIVALLAAISNAFWHYLSFNLMFDFVDPAPFSYFFTYDITYNIGIIGTLRYPALFMITLTFFLINVLLHRKGIDFFDLYQKKSMKGINEHNHNHH